MRSRTHSQFVQICHISILPELVMAHVIVCVYVCESVCGCVLFHLFIYCHLQFFRTSSIFECIDNSVHTFNFVLCHKSCQSVCQLAFNRTRCNIIFYCRFVCVSYRICVNRSRTKRMQIGVYIQLSASA